MFQSTRPTWGATERGVAVFSVGIVSIHAPHVGRDAQQAQQQRLHGVSIHAPHVGRDDGHRSGTDGRRCFNPRAPRGARLPESFGVWDGRGFNPRAPRGARRNNMVKDRILHKFQSTRPTWGATFPFGPIRLGDVVSIHAPHVGRDQHGDAAILPGLHRFNPRAPRGARRMRLGSRAGYDCFNPRAPRGARRASLPYYVNRLEVSIHAPHVGRDVERLPYCTANPSFNPRAPRGARPEWPHRIFLTYVSIHAPHVGRDGRRDCGWADSSCFNPRAPRGARHKIPILEPWLEYVSIHAPHVGRDGRG